MLTAVCVAACVSHPKQAVPEAILAQMRADTADMLKRRQEEFAASSNTSIGQIVNPLKETIDRMKEAMKENTIKQTSISSEIKTQAENMMRQSAAAKESADELTRVFRHAGRVQGNWGEIILDELLESQGLTKGVHYELQSSIRDAAGDVVRTEDDRSMRPDVILHLDQKRDVIIDSKVSLTAFMDYVNAEDEGDRQKYLKAHVDSIQKHVKASLLDHLLLVNHQSFLSSFVYSYCVLVRLTFNSTVM